VKNICGVEFETSKMRAKMLRKIINLYKGHKPNNDGCVKVSNEKKIDNLFLSIGMMKTSTTWLYFVLRLHPDIYFSYEKEIHYFAHLYSSMKLLDRTMRFKKMRETIENQKYNQYNQQKLKKELIWYLDYINEPINDNWYINLFKNRANEKYCADFSNLTCHVNKDGWKSIKNITRNLKVILILRHPVQRLFSHVNFHFLTIDKHNQLSNWSKSDYLDFFKNDYIRKNSLYADIVKNLIENVPKKQYRIYFYEEIIKNMKKFIENIENFLGIKNYSYPNNIINNKICATMKISMPNFFFDLFKDEFRMDVKRLNKIGIQTPEEWDDLFC